MCSIFLSLFLSFGHGCVAWRSVYDNPLLHIEKLDLYCMSMRCWLLVFKCLDCLVEKKNKSKVLLASMKTLTNSKNYSGSLIIISVQAFLSCHWSIFFSVHTLFGAGKIWAKCICPIGSFRHDISGLQAFSGSKSPRQSPWRGLLEGFLELVNNFTEASKNFVIYITTVKSFRFLNNTSARTKITELIFLVLRNNHVTKNPFLDWTLQHVGRT